MAGVDDIINEQAFAAEEADYEAALEADASGSAAPPDAQVATVTVANSHIPLFFVSTHPHVQSQPASAALRKHKQFPRLGRISRHNTCKDRAIGYSGADLEAAG